MQFDEIVGRAQLKEQLRDLVEQNRLSHSILFLGKEGSGALPLAIAFAQFILCERVNKPAQEPAPSLFGDMEPEAPAIIRADSCGVCAACTKVARLVHPDLHFSYPVLKRDSRHDRILSTDYISEWRGFVETDPYGNIEDWTDYLGNNARPKIENAANKQPNISVMECEDILHKLSLRPFESEFKVLIMWMPEYLGKEGNRLLKLIEEPPSGTIFLFVAEDDSQILPTILSRTQIIRVPLPEDSEVAHFLENREVSREKATSIAGVVAGNIREALRMIDAGDEEWERTVRDWLNLAVSNRVELLSKWIDDINTRGREKQKQLLNYFISIIHLAIRLKYAGKELVHTMNESEKELAARLGAMCDIGVLEEMANELNKSIYYIERNANSKMLFHALTIRLRYLIKEKYLILVK